MNVKELQKWLNDHGATPALVEDGIGGTKTKQAILQIFTNKKAEAITDEELLELSKELDQTDTKRLKAVSTVESGGSGWFNSGLVKILYERHYFYKLTSQAVRNKTKGKWFISASSGDYTSDANKNNINDSWEKLCDAACFDPDAAFQSVSIGKFQIMGAHYKSLGYSHPIEMLYEATQSEYSHYKMLVGFLKANKLVNAFKALSTKPEDCRALARGYNGPLYEKYDYHNKLAKAMR